jgi:hypothetical protein
MTLTEHARAIRSAIRALERGDAEPLSAALDWDRAQVWARESLADHVRIPVADSAAPWVLVVHRVTGLPLTARVTGHTWSREIRATPALLTEALSRTAGLPLFDVAGWLSAARV